MAKPGHPWRDGVSGRGLTTRPGVGGVSITAHLTCSGCGRIGDVKLRAIMPPDQIDRKFRQAGWRLDPHQCPACIQSTQETKEARTMPPTPSPAAMKAQAVMFNLLTLHFDPVAGRYSVGWSDAKVASETGLDAAFVRDFRDAGFGPLREPEELIRFRADIAALEQLQRETAATISEQIASLRADLARIAKTGGR